jgi:hypothetical protein
MKIIPFLLRLFPRGIVLAAVSRIQLRKRGRPAREVVVGKTWAGPLRKSA